MPLRGGDSLASLARVKPIPIANVGFPDLRNGIWLRHHLAGVASRYESHRHQANGNFLCARIDALIFLLRYLRFLL